jgi:hypothetical protein
MRDRETIDSELRLPAAVRWSIREHGGEPSSRQLDELLNERLAHRGRAGEGTAVDTYCLAHRPPRRIQTRPAHAELLACLAAVPKKMHIAG